MRLSVCCLVCVLMACSVLAGENGSNADMTKVMDCLLKGDLGSAEKLLKSSAGEGDEWGVFKKSVEQVLTMPDLVWKAYTPLKGKTTTVYLKSGTKKLLIMSVTPKEIIAEKQFVSGGRVVGAAENNFTYQDLSPREKMIRLGKKQSPEFNIMRGVLACSAGVPDKATPFFEKAGDGLGKMFIERMETQKEEKVIENLAAKKAGDEKAAESAYNAILKDAGIPVSEDIVKVAAAVRAKKHSKIAVMAVRKSLSAFRSKFSETDFAEEHSAVIETLNRSLPLFIDPTSAKRDLEKAMEKLQKANPGAKIVSEVKIKENGIILNLKNNAHLNDISALSGLPIKSLNLSKTTVNNLKALTGMPISELNIEKCKGIWSLEPLNGMPLTVLNLRCCTGVKNIEPLRGMPLTELFLGYGNLYDNGRVPVKNLEPLIGMSLKKLDLVGSKVSDLTPLKGMPLVSLYINSTQVSDLTPLKGMPLVSLNICGLNIKDLTPIENIKTLKDLKR